MRLNALQRKSLALIQEIAGDRSMELPEGGAGEVLITRIPHAHGDHLHVGGGVVMDRDATGLANQGVWKALVGKRR